MLPSNLLITRRWKNKIWPIYADLDKKNLGLATTIINIYKKYVGEKKGELTAALSTMEDLGYDYRFIRGLSYLLNKRCNLELTTNIDPIKIRQKLFKLSSEMGIPITLDDRHKIMEKAASDLKLTINELEEYLYSDLNDELIIKDFKPIEPIELLKQYNLSLTQTILFFSTEITFTTNGNWQNIFRQIKWLGLIYEIIKRDRGYYVKVNGPASLFKLNRRYGTSIAKLLPQIIKCDSWWLNAKILPQKTDKRLYDLTLSSNKHGHYMYLHERKPVESYDSNIELDFARRFRAMNTGWTLIREPEPIPVSKWIMIPDFCFLKGNVKIYLEIVGFWTPRYLQNKLKKLRLLKDIDMLVAADKNLECEALNKLKEKLNIIYYTRKIPLNPILTYLREKERLIIRQEINSLDLTKVTIKKPFINIKELAEQFGVLKETVKIKLQKEKLNDYQLVGDFLVSASKLKEIKDVLDDKLKRHEVNLIEASALMKSLDGVSPISILTALGYKIIWHGINQRSAKVRKKT